MRPGQAVDGPAIVKEPTGTNIVEPGWRAEINAWGHLILRRTMKKQRAEAVGTKVDPIMLEVFNNLFMSIAEQMGATLANTAYSVNIKERLDFSCALFDPTGGLVANAPHVPVHLGSMSESIRTIIRLNPDMKKGDVFVLNAPFNGGTHLPDVTVITPVFDEAGRDVLFFVASRGHHADIGGKTPGSAPPDSTRDRGGGRADRQLQDDRRRPFPRGRDARAAAIRHLPGAQHRGEHGGPGRPGRRQRDRRARGRQDDPHLRAGDGARLYGPRPGQCRGMRAPRRHGADGRALTTTSWTTASSSASPSASTARSARRPSTSPARPRRTATTTTPRSPSATRWSCTSSARWSAADIPLNEGCFKALNIIAPKGSMINAEYPAAVIAGNTEVSQLMCNALFGALGVIAGSQGDDEQLRLGQCAPAELRDDLRRHGRGAGLRRLLGHPDAHDEHPRHRSGGAGVPLPRAARGVLDPPRLGRQGPAHGRRRHHAADALPRADDRHHALLAPPRAALRRRRRRARRGRPRMDRARRRHASRRTRATTSTRSIRATSSSCRRRRAAAMARREA